MSALPPFREWNQRAKRAAMGIDWMNRTELSQAIPPVYSEWIARQWIAQRRAA